MHTLRDFERESLRRRGICPISFFAALAEAGRASDRHSVGDGMMAVGAVGHGAATVSHCCGAAKTAVFGGCSGMPDGIAPYDALLRPGSAYGRDGL